MMQLEAASQQPLHRVRPFYDLSPWDNYQSNAASTPLFLY